MPKTTPRREETRRRLVQAAITEFARYGIDAVSVEQLCDAAGFSRGAFYSNFTSKDDLCIAILADYGEHISTGLPKTLKSIPPDADATWLATNGIATYFNVAAPDEDHRRTMAELGQRALRNPELVRAAAEISEQIRTVIIDALIKVSERLGFSWRIEPRTLTEILTALFLSQGFYMDSSPDHFLTLMAVVLDAAIEPDNGHSDQDKERS